MKKLTVPRFFMTVLMVLAGLALYSCNDSDGQDIPPVKMEELPGNYKGKLIIIQGNSKREGIKEFKVKKDTISFAEFPVTEIVKTVVKDPAKAETAIKALGKVKYDLKYAAVINTANNVIELTLTPKTMELQIPVDGVNKKTVVEFVSKQKGYYVGMDRTLRYALTAEKITVDGTVVTPYEVIDYNFPFCIKN
ncbi:Uncharacterised protein [Chryseobacterium gleum]|uniref:DUF4840 domain-containing protein n=2 Tax=Chryseobacterium gleum TaxID=250 RepID=A0A3S4M841_CHRGE|nr:DUF4840 domain-containing protein [Chryseobacterium gleum]EFK37612.1 hypothetical protein HMPREF0204_10385 [Chryseobacterium gleum ATCC 35910]MCD9618277.1 DUF4840 domain-containing protein [Chryseobacterium gleum]QBJ87368.1 DUF4840 domain-containing protein [Chryseobacterium gleum]QQY32902.1 DUF4840 domain-containing protein [Chryseobacterium gleum]VEE09852.1 Uncharacterised protein [Chryseobacterium gleum]